MKKLLAFFPFLLFSYYYPLEFKFRFIHNCMENSSIPNKYQYCQCVLKKLENRFKYQYFLWNSTSMEVLNFIKKASRECLKR